MHFDTTLHAFPRRREQVRGALAASPQRCVVSDLLAVGLHRGQTEADLPPQFELKSNTFSIEFPPRSGKFREFPEVDRAEFFPEEIARQKINPAQIPFLDRLRDSLHAS